MPPLGRLTAAWVNHLEGGAVKLGKMRRLMKRVDSYGRRVGIEMDGEWDKRRVGRLYHVVVENMVPKKKEKRTRCKKELAWETFYRYYKLV